MEGIRNTVMLKTERIADLRECSKCFVENKADIECTDTSYETPNVLLDGMLSVIMDLIC